MKGSGGASEVMRRFPCSITAWVGHGDPFSFLPLWALSTAVTVLSSGQSGLTKSGTLQILLAGDLWPTQLCNRLAFNRGALKHAKHPRIYSEEGRMFRRKGYPSILDPKAACLNKTLPLQTTT